MNFLEKLNNLNIILVTLASIATILGISYFDIELAKSSSLELGDNYPFPDESVNIPYNEK